MRKLPLMALSMIVAGSAYAVPKKKNMHDRITKDQIKTNLSQRTEALLDLCQGSGMLDIVEDFGHHFPHQVADGNDAYIPEKIKMLEIQTNNFDSISQNKDFQLGDRQCALAFKDYTREASENLMRYEQDYSLRIDILRLRQRSMNTYKAIETSLVDSVTSLQKDIARINRDIEIKAKIAGLVVKEKAGEAKDGLVEAASNTSAAVKRAAQREVRGAKKLGDQFGRAFKDGAEFVGAAGAYLAKPIVEGASTAATASKNAATATKNFAVDSARATKDLAVDSARATKDFATRNARATQKLATDKAKATKSGLNSMLNGLGNWFIALIDD